jgi:hypothetical protein
LSIKIGFTNEIEVFLAHKGPRASYGKQPLGNELFFQSHGLLTEQGIESVDINVREWEDTKCFFAVSEKSAVPFDVFAAAFYLLSRYEEYLPHVKDHFGRFSASESLGYKYHFLDSPVIDIWSYKLKALLQQEFPEILFPKRETTVHNLINAQAAFAFLNKGIFRSFIGFTTDLFKLRLKQFMLRTKVVLGLRRDPYDSYKWVVNVAKNSAMKLTVFFLLGEAVTFEESINTRKQKFKMLIKYVADYKEVGLLVSLTASTNTDLLKIEKRTLENIINRNIESSQNSNLLIGLPEMYRNLVSLEIEKDYTMVYENEAGFRAGTCTPFLFYDLDYEIITPLAIQPIACTTQGFLKQSPMDTSIKINEMLTKVQGVHGTFSVLFSNKDFSVDPNNKLWRSLFSETLIA